MARQACKAPAPKTQGNDATTGHGVPAYPPQVGRPIAYTTATPAEAYPELHSSAADAFHTGRTAGVRPGHFLGPDGGYTGFHPPTGQPTAFGRPSGYAADGYYAPAAGPTTFTISGQDADRSDGRPMLDEKEPCMCFAMRLGRSYGNGSFS